uniref:SdrD B-like domain-containing protein n=1 Tax=Marinobacterium profundum TaxID=1714300 RepID=UPI00082E1E28|nr:SdrD B-like domain-containing protein [Marinobacterium profundum]
MKNIKQSGQQKPFARHALWCCLTGLLLGTGVAQADYLGTGTTRVFIDPDSLPAIIDGYQVGDIVSIIAETTPDPNSGSTVGAGAWNTQYVPDGAEIVGAAIVVANPDGTYSSTPVTDVSEIARGCGPRGCKYPVTGSFQNGTVGHSQQDTGIFYSTDPRTRQLATPYRVSPTGSNVTPQDAWNEWDYWQVLAYGTGDALTGNGGQGNTPITLDTTSGIWTGSGSPVAGPDVYYTNDYNDNCIGGGLATLQDKTSCVGPWQRISYPNSKIAASGLVRPPLATDGEALANDSVLTSAGHSFSGDGALPSNTNAVRFVFGERRLGELEYTRLSFRITDAAAFTNSIELGDVCADATGGDTDKEGRGPQDNIWRYFEGNGQSCLVASTAANLHKTITHVDNVAGASSAQQDSIVAFKISIANTGIADLHDIAITDLPLDNDLALLPPGDPNCPYASYDGNWPGGLPTFTGIAGDTGSWSTVPSIGAGESFEVYICAQVDSKAKIGSALDNEATATFSKTSGGTTEAPLTSIAKVLVNTKISGTLYLDNDRSGTLTTGDNPLTPVSVQLWIDENGNGVLESGTDTLVDTAVTNNAGGYLFSGLEAGDYLVVETDTDYAAIADIDTALGACATGNSCSVIAVALDGGAASIGNDFFKVGASIGDTLYADSNNNGVQDAGEPGIEGVTLDLLDSGSEVIATLTTDASGLYNFNELVAGSYTVVVTDTDSVLRPGFLHDQTADPDATLDGQHSLSVTAGEVVDTVDFGYLPLVINLTTVKSVVTLSDPVNGTSNPKAIPGAEVEYTITVTNLGNGRTDDGTFVITDLIDPSLEVFVGDFSGAATGPVELLQGATSSDLTYNYESLNSVTDDLEFSSDSGATYSYSVTPDADNFDTLVNAVRLTLGGQLQGSDGTLDPSFSVRFKARVK